MLEAVSAENVSSLDSTELLMMIALGLRVTLISPAADCSQQITTRARRNSVEHERTIDDMAGFIEQWSSVSEAQV
jgi:hypothetical protein